MESKLGNDFRYKFGKQYTRSLWAILFFFLSRFQCFVYFKANHTTLLQHFKERPYNGSNIGQTRRCHIQIRTANIICCKTLSFLTIKKGRNVSCLSSHEMVIFSLNEMWLCARDCRPRKMIKPAKYNL